MAIKKKIAKVAAKAVMGGAKAVKGALGGPAWWAADFIAEALYRHDTEAKVKKSKVTYPKTRDVKTSYAVEVVKRKPKSNGSSTKVTWKGDN